MHHPLPEPGSRSEAATQDRRDSEYREGWRTAPESFKAKARTLGIDSSPERRTGAAMAFDEGRDTAGYTPDFAAIIDRTVDLLIEKHGNEKLVREIVESLEEPMKQESYRTQAGAIIRVVSWLIKCPKGNARARIHGVMHAIPGLPESANIKSMRESSRICGVSPEWLREARNQACDWLGLPIPVTGQKTEGAKAKYKLRTHWRHAKMTT